MTGPPLTARQAEALAAVRRLYAAAAAPVRAKALAAALGTQLPRACKVLDVLCGLRYVRRLAGRPWRYEPIAGLDPPREPLHRGGWCRRYRDRPRRRAKPFVADAALQAAFRAAKAARGEPMWATDPFVPRVYRTPRLGEARP